MLAAAATSPAASPDEERWEVGLTEWRLVGPNLISLIVCLALRMRQSRRSIQKFLRDWFGIELSTSTINQCLHEAGRAVEPLEESLVEEVRAAVLAHADETTWKEAGQLLWLWVVATATVSLYLIGYRTAELITAALGEGFEGWLRASATGSTASSGSACAAGRTCSARPRVSRTASRGKAAPSARPVTPC